MGLMPSGHGAFVFWSRVVLPPIMQYSQFSTRISFNALQQRGFFGDMALVEMDILWHKAKSAEV